MRSAKAIPFPIYCAYLSGVLAAIIGGTGLLGWAMDVQWLTALWPQLQAMRPNAALAMLLSGLALLLMLPYRPAVWRRWIGRSLAVVILLMAGVALFSIFTGIDIPSNAMLFQQDKFPVASVGPERFPMRMGLPAAVGFLLTALALLLLDMKPRGGWSASQFLSLATTTIGGLGLLGHAYNAAILYQLTTYTVISAHIALGLVCMGVGLLLARPNLFPAAMLMSQGSSGTVGRRLLLPIVLGPAVLGLLWMDLVQQNWLSTAEAMAGFVMLIVLMLMGLTWWCMAAVARVDRQRDQAEEALRQSEERLLQLGDNIPGGAIYQYIRRPDGSIRNAYMSAGIEKIIGMMAGDVMADPASFLDLIAQEDRPRYAMAEAHSARELAPFDYEFRQRTVTGQVKWVHCRSTPRRLDDGLIVWDGVVTDITERKRAELERETTVEFLRLVNGSTGTRDLVQAAATFFQKQSGCEALGIRIKEGDDYPYYEARGFPAEFVRLENSLCSRDHAGSLVRDSRGNPIIECLCGNVICGRFNPAKPFFSAHGSFWTNGTTELLATTRDADRQARTRNRCNGEGYESVALIPLHLGEERLGLLQLNDRRQGLFSSEIISLWERLADNLAVALAKFRADEVLRQSEEQHRLFFEMGAVGMAYASPEGILVKVNDRYCELTGYSREEIIGKADDELTHPDDRARNRQQMGAYLRGELAEFVSEKRYLRKDGAVRWVAVTARMVREADGRLRHSIGIIEDITERKRAEEALRASEERFRLRFFHFSEGSRGDTIKAKFCYLTANLG